MDQILNQLLTASNTVIMPHFGAILKIGSGYQFNEFLKYNDGKLITAVQENKKLSKEEATEVVSDYIRKIKEHLNADKNFTVDKVGTISKKAGKIIISNENKPEKSSSEPISIIKPKESSTVIKKEKGTITPVEKKTEDKKIAQPVKDVQKKEHLEKEELPKAYTSSNLVIDNAIEKISKLNTIDELNAFIKEESREKVLKAYESRKNQLLKPKVTPTPIIQTSTSEIKDLDVKIKEDKNIIKSDPKKKTDPISDSPSSKVAEKTSSKTPVISKDEKKENKLKKEENKLATPIKKEDEKNITSKKEDEKIEKELMAGAIVIEKEAKKRKRNRLILWVAILLLLIGSSIIGYLKKNDILALVNKTEIVENKTDEKGSNKKEEPNETSIKHNDSNKEELDKVEQNKIENKNESIATSNPENENPEKKEEVVQEDIVEEETTQIEKEIVEEVKPKSSGGKYNIIGGSFSSESNANKLVSKLKEDGYSSAKLLGKYGKLHTVSIDNFASRGEAKSALSNIKAKGYSCYIKKV